MLRRRVHQRSVNGCLTCKERHIRCDETLPYCRNCLRLGKTCRYRDRSSSEQQTEAEESASLQESNMTHFDSSQFHGRYSPPRQNAVSSAALEIVQEAEEFSSLIPMPPSCTLTIAQDYTPKFEFLAENCESVRHSLVSLASYTHFQASKSPVSEEIWMHHTSIAMYELQKEIANFSQYNSDSIVTASIVLASSAYDWNQWAVFVDGYSKALSQIESYNFVTSFPDLLGQRFQMWYIASTANPMTPQLPRDGPRMMQRVREIKSRISHTRKHHLRRSTSTGFTALADLATSVEAAILLPTEDDMFHGLSWLRSWLFWIDLRIDNVGDDQLALTAVFYALVLSVLPLFPSKYSMCMRDVCVSKMIAAKQQMLRGTGLHSELTKLVDDAVSWF